MKKQMYFAGTECDKVKETTIAYQVASVRPEIDAQRSLSDGIRERLYIPEKQNPKKLVAIVRPSAGNIAYKASFVENMCMALLPEDHYYKTDELSEKLLRVLTAPDSVKNLRLVAVTIADGRLCFKVWQAISLGCVDIKVLPLQLRGTDNFDFGIQANRRSTNRIQIKCVLDGGDKIRYIVEQYQKDRITSVREICYHTLKGNNRQDNNKPTVPHFIGYMNTLTVQ